MILKEKLDKMRKITVILKMSKSFVTTMVLKPRYITIYSMWMNT